eukprot:TRINITY_DN7450_c0_g1_i3.p2 TRINITY_DN7450_c0_g1~~TRINITY_DN7450_c0_g1_i3.p2  ORF type:complete len:112 (-),score=11.08 TRINITY_DN7450_c0_g1_i3:282-617(-)
MQNTKYSTVKAKNTKIKDKKTPIDGIQISHLDKNIFIQPNQKKKQNKNQKTQSTEIVSDAEEIRMKDLNLTDEVLKVTINSIIGTINNYNWRIQQSLRLQKNGIKIDCNQK